MHNLKDVTLNCAKRSQDGLDKCQNYPFPTKGEKVSIPYSKKVLKQTLSEQLIKSLFN